MAIHLSMVGYQLDDFLPHLNHGKWLFHHFPSEKNCLALGVPGIFTPEKNEEKKKHKFLEVWSRLRLFQ